MKSVLAYSEYRIVTLYFKIFITLKKKTKTNHTHEKNQIKNKTNKQKEKKNHRQTDQPTTCILRYTKKKKNKVVVCLDWGFGHL